MTEPTKAEPIEVVSLEDLDLLDDANRHARCMLCTGWEVPLGQPFTAICGTRAIYLNEWTGAGQPPDACPKCVAMFGTCPVHGGSE